MARWCDEQLLEISLVLKKMLATELFAGAPRQKRFLEYLVDSAIRGEDHRLKGYKIALEVFDRAKDFDPSVDAIVRVEAMRLRNKLRDYHDQYGHTDAVKIDLPKGGYHLSFKFMSDLPLDINPGLLAVAPPTSQAIPPPLITETPSLVVLPFANLSQDPTREYFADGMTDSLISLLARLSGLFVISRQSSFAYKNTTLSCKEIAQALGVRYLLEGSVQHAGDRVRIHAYLVNAQDGMHVWSHRYDKNLQDIFLLQDEITQHIVRALQVELSGLEGKMFGYHDTQSVAAYDNLLRGISHFRQYTQHAAKEALRLFDATLAIDADYATAHAWRARTLCFQWCMFWDQDKQILNDALTHATLAVTLNPQSAYAISILGWVHVWRKESASAIEVCRQAVQLDPNNAESLLFLSLALSSAGIGSESQTLIEKAKRLTPTPAPLYAFALGQAYYVQKAYDKAIAAFEQGIAMSPTFIPTHYLQMLAYAQLGEVVKVREKMRTLRQIAGHHHQIPAVEIWTNQALAKHQFDLANQLYADASLNEPMAGTSSSANHAY